MKELNSNNYYIFWVRSCSCSRCPACNVHVLYCHLWHVPLYAIFPHSLINNTSFEKIKVVEYKMLILNFCATFVWNISQSRKSWVRYNYECTKFFMYSTHYSCQVLIKLDFSWQVFKKSTHIILHENPSSGSRVVLWGRTLHTQELLFEILQTCPKSHT